MVRGELLLQKAPQRKYDENITNQRQLTNIDTIRVQKSQGEIPLFVCFSTKPLAGTLHRAFSQ